MKNLITAFYFGATLLIIGWFIIGSPLPSQAPIEFYETEPIGPPPSHIEIYLDGQGYWNIIIDGEAVCTCKGVDNANR